MTQCYDRAVIGPRPRRRVRVAALAAALALAVALVPGDGVRAQQAPPPAPWREKAEVNVRYDIRGRLVEGASEDDALRLVGDETIVWTNTSQDRVGVLYFHLYPNAFRNTRSTFLREALRDGRKLPDDMAFGEMEVQQVEVKAMGATLTPRYVSPDDQNPDDRTVMFVKLPQPIEPDEVQVVTVKFTVDFPRVFARMGQHRSFLMAAQWYPKLGKYVGLAHPRAQEGWYCPQYHANGEFFADYADYDVSLQVPQRFTVGATGRRSAEETKDDTRTETWHARSVVDFAWTAHDRFVRHTRRIAPVDPQDSRDPVTAEWLRVQRRLDEPVPLPEVEVELLLQPEHADQAERHFEAARVALGLFGTWLGPYPYDRLTIVDPPHGARFAGGMEYPQLVTAGTVRGSPEGSQRPEHVIVHEIGHQWFMNLLATNEVEEAWLDEGLNSYFTAKALDLRWGPARQFEEILGFHVGRELFYRFPGIAVGWPEALGLPDWATPPAIDVLRAWRDLPPLTGVESWRYLPRERGGEEKDGDDSMLPFRRSYLARSAWDEMVKPAYRYADRVSYRVNAYARPALFVATLRRTLRDEFGETEGERRFLRAMREYARAGRFRHPTTEDFLRAFKEHGRDPGPLADALVRTAAPLDYAIESVDDLSEPKFEGRGAADPAEPEVKPDVEPEAKRTNVRLRRRGEAIVPIQLEVRHADGRTERVKWETSAQAPHRWRDFTFEGELAAVRLDPDGVYLQDEDRTDASWTRETSYRPAAKWSVRLLLWMETALLSYGRFL